jgi:AcrR family transcriptional regulator
MAKSRITKDPELRKTEILNAAEELFLSRGFDETSVSDIVVKVGVAQGLFYYYFKSKDDILNAVLERFTDNLFTELEIVGNDDRLNAAQKLRLVFKFFLDMTQNNEKMVIFMHDERNELLHHRLEHKSLDKMLSFFMNIVEQGIREKIFELDFPRETVEILFIGFVHYAHGMVKQIKELELLAAKFDVSLAIFEKALGAAPGCLVNLSESIGENHEQSDYQSE